MFIFEQILQIWMIVTSILGSFFVASKNKNIIKWGFLLLFAGQVSYFYICFFPVFRFGLFITSIFFTFSWVKGIYHYWIQK